MTPPANNSYGRILKSSTLLGGSSLISVVLSAVRTKILALYLGPSLFGVMGLYTTWLTMLAGITSLGLGSSAVREVAVAAGSGDTILLSRTIQALRRLVWITGTIGMLVGLLLAFPASIMTFGNGAHAVPIAFLSVTLLLTQLQIGQTAIVQGTRRIGDLTKIAIVGAAWSTAIAIPVLLAFGQAGIVPFLLAVAGGQLLASWWYTRHDRFPGPPIEWVETWQHARAMLGLGIVFVLAGLAGAVSNYVIRLIIQHQLGVSAVGLYASSFNIAGVYVGFVLQAMAGDYYPRLAGLVGDSSERNRLVNEQAEMAVLLAVPGLSAALVLASPLISILYSIEFLPAADMFRWQLLGMLGRIVSWPLGMILLARADRVGFLCVELLAAAAHVVGVWIGVVKLGLAGAGAAFAGLYVANTILVWALAASRHGFIFDGRTCRVLGIGVTGVLAAFLSTWICAPVPRISAGFVIIVVLSVFACRGLMERIGHARMVQGWQAIRSRFGVGSA